MTPTTEQLLCTPLGHDVSTASPVQRARCRIGDGLPLEELREDSDVVAMCGGPEATAALPSESGTAPNTVIDVSSIRSCKTMMAVCRAARAVFAVDTSVCRIGEVPRIALFSLKLSRARVAFRMLAALFARPALRGLVISSTAEALTVRHPSGVPIEIVCVAGGRAAQDFVGDWLAGVIADEAPRMLGRDEGVTNLADVLTAIRGRLLPSAQVQLIGSPWAPNGPVYDLVQERFGKPGPDVVVLRSTGPQNNPAYFTPERCAEMERTDPVAYSTSVLAEFSDPETGLLSAVSLRKNTRETPLETLPDSESDSGAAVDVGRGRWTLAIVEAFEATDDHQAFKVALAREIVTQSPDAAWKEIASLCQRYGLERASVDQYAAAESRAIAKRYGLDLVERPWTAASRLEAFTNLATLMHSDRIELPPERTLQRDLRSVKKRATQQGYTIVLPQTSDGRHCDFAPTLAAAVKAAADRAGAVDVEMFIEMNAPEGRLFDRERRLFRSEFERNR